MEEHKRIEISGKAVSVRGNDIDTDRIIPARFLRCVVFDGLGEHAFEDDRKMLKANDKTHPLDDPGFADSEILMVNKNFGCGSSREHAPQAIMRWSKGIKAIIGESFAEIFFGNCVALGIPCITVDEQTIQALMDANEGDKSQSFSINIESKTITTGSGETFSFEMSDGVRNAFIEGRWDTTVELLENKEAIASTASNLPYFNGWK